FLIFINLAWHLIVHPPFNLINITLALLLWVIVSNPRGNYWPYILYVAFVNELFEKTSFGITALPLIFTLLFVHWLLLNIFTNRSLITVFLSGFCALILYRLLFIGSDFLFYSAADQSTFNAPQLKLFLTEATLTASVLGVGYLISAFFIKRLHPEYINRGHIL
ncbi:MAG: hypothetical protein NT034_00660, partial [Candidatus Magasanikbacteria bacterium]|nr:hypothetical protein [Candidatus Magasanikbacteria bacterium]